MLLIESVSKLEDNSSPSKLSFLIVVSLMRERVAGIATSHFSKHVASLIRDEAGCETSTWVDGVEEMSVIEGEMKELSTDVVTGIIASEIDALSTISIVTMAETSSSSAAVMRGDCWRSSAATIEEVLITSAGELTELSSTPWVAATRAEVSLFPATVAAK